ncbi:glycosyltransferase WbuB [Trinickia acidisoli]|uniref:glycosyltransferase WbuB n=1 Tax=Trinickia acidisoli TaxID=2767482 RepID=UPI001A8CA28B|nr:glycosyltransferase WbuB [Trinickia acidisoli]
MKLLLYGLNYAPELTGTGKYTAEMAEALAARGHEVHVVCAPPYYPAWRVAAGWSAWRYGREVRGGVTVRRAPLWVPSHPRGATRVAHLASFALTSILPMLAQWRWHPDVVIAIAPTLLCAPAALALAHATRARAWLHVQDFEVDAAFGLGLLVQPHAARVAHAFERAVLHRFDVVSSISPKMVERLLMLGVEPSRVLCLPNWVDVTTIRPLDRASVYRQTLGISDDEKVVLYAGNMGAKQGLEHLVSAAALLERRTDIRFVFCGDGLLREEVARQCAGLANCVLIGLQPAAQLNELLNVADVHVLPQRADAADLVMPSKLAGMMASGRAIVAMAREGTQLADTLAGRAVVVEPDDGPALARAIEAVADDAQMRARLGESARRYAMQAFSPDAVMERLEQRLYGALIDRTGPETETSARTFRPPR